MIRCVNYMIGKKGEGRKIVWERERKKRKKNKEEKKVSEKEREE